MCEPQEVAYERSRHHTETKALGDAAPNQAPEKANLAAMEGGDVVKCQTVEAQSVICYTSMTTSVDVSNESSELAQAVSMSSFMTHY